MTIDMQVVDCGACGGSGVVWSPLPSISVPHVQVSPDDRAPPLSPGFTITSPKDSTTTYFDTGDGEA